MADYDWSYETPIDPSGDRNAEEWLRATWEDGPKFVRVLLPIAWKYALGLRLGPKSDPSRVLGWHVANAEPDAATVDADSRLMWAENVVTVDRGTLRWRTVVDHQNVLGRALWLPASVVHQILVPWLLRRAVRLHDPRPSRL